MGHVTKFTDHVRRYAVALAVVAGGALAPTLAMAQAQEWQVYLDEPQSPIMERVVSFNNGLMIVISLITLFVLGLLAWVIIRYRASRNPVPSKTTHNTVVEVLWTILPVLILVGIAIPSFSLLFAQYDPSRVIDNYDPAQVLNVKVTGQTWFWQYEYPDEGIAAYSSNPITVADATETTMFGGEPTRVFGGTPRLLETDYPMVVPVNTVVRLQVTSPATGVIHSFAMPSMGVKLDAVPGRLSESWLLAEHEGTFYGQCSELCGRYHYAMPIELRVVTQDQFDQWVAAMAAGNRDDAKALLDQWEEERLANVVAAR
jgi:cytochrome c oxidase subunit 2